MTDKISKSEEKRLQEHRRIQVEKLMLMGHTKPAIILDMISDPLHPEPEMKAKEKSNPYFSVKPNRENWSLGTIRNDMDYIRSEWSNDRRQGEENAAFLYGLSREMLKISHEKVLSEGTAAWSKEMREWGAIFAQYGSVHEDERQENVLEIKARQQDAAERLLRLVEKNNESDEPFTLLVDGDKDAETHS